MRLAFVLAALAASAPSAARATDAGTFAQAIVIGANRSVDRELAPLRFADDDAARFAELFGELGVKTYLLTRADESTAKLHPEVLAGARPPTREELRAVVGEAAQQAAQARARGQQPILYVVFAGHGNTHGDRAYVTLEDARLYVGDVLDGIVAPVAPAQAHVLVDACHSELFALSRGPGGTHRAARGFLEGALGAGATSVGFLLASSQSGESHEWDAFQSGVFSHEVRSGLMGAADVDGDGRVSYREIAAFVSRANAAIVNDHFRPAVYARPPAGTETLLDLRPALRRRIHVDGAATGKHFLIEDSRGVRWGDFHSALDQPLDLLLPAAHAPFYVRGLRDGREAVLDGRAPVVALAAQPLRRAEADSRGAAHHAFRTLFSLPFDREAVDAFDLQAEHEEHAPSAGLRTYAGWTALGLAAAAAGTGGYLLLRNRAERESTDARTSQMEVVARNERMSSRSSGARWLFGGGAVAAAAGLGLLLWPSAPAEVAVLPEGGAAAQLAWRW